MKKSCLLIVMSLLGLRAAQAQHFTHGLGAAVLFMHSESAMEQTFIGFTYSPRFSFAEGKNTSLSLGIPLVLGFSRVSLPGMLDPVSPSLMVSAPLVLNFNLGAGSSKACHKKYGFFVGGGYGYYRTNYAMEEEYLRTDRLQTANMMGATANVGLRIGMGWQRKKSLEIKAFYLQGSTEHKPNTFGTACLLNF
jgi:hypothetical protein